MPGGQRVCQHNTSELLNSDIFIWTLLPRWKTFYLFIWNERKKVLKQFLNRNFGIGCRTKIRICIYLKKIWVNSFVSSLLKKKKKIALFIFYLYNTLSHVKFSNNQPSPDWVCSRIAGYLTSSLYTPGFEICRGIHSYILVHPSPANVHPTLLVLIIAHMAIDSIGEKKKKKPSVLAVDSSHHTGCIQSYSHVSPNVLNGCWPPARRSVHPFDRSCF